VLGNHSTIGLLADQAFSGSRWSGRDAWRAAAEAGASWISICEEALDADEEQLAKWRDDAEVAGTPIVMAAVHAFGLSDPRDRVREFNLERSLRHVDLVRNLGARRLKVLFGEWVWRGMWPDELQWRYEVDTVRKLTEYAESRGVTLSIELEPLETSLVNDPASMRRLIDDVASPVLLANVDTSHMVVRGTNPAEIRQLAGMVDTVDFSDSHGRYHQHLPPGAGIADLPSFAAELTHSRPSSDALLAVEVGPFADPENAFVLVKESIDSTRRLFEAARESAGATRVGAEDV
jgi:sugar phosphate isomerase/epimerase